jgi:hypothetical protein
METSNYWEGKVTKPEQRTCNLGVEGATPHPLMSNPLPSFDAEIWAAAFISTLRRNPEIIVDHSLMVTWFANALMRGYDEHRYSTKEYKASVRRILHPWWSWKRYTNQQQTA